MCILCSSRWGKDKRGGGRMMVSERCAVSVFTLRGAPSRTVQRVTNYKGTHRKQWAPRSFTAYHEWTLSLTHTKYRLQQKRRKELLHTVAFTKKIQKECGEYFTELSYGVKISPWVHSCPVVSPDCHCWMKPYSNDWQNVLNLYITTISTTLPSTVAYKLLGWLDQFPQMNTSLHDRIMQIQ